MILERNSKSDGKAKDDDGDDDDDDDAKGMVFFLQDSATFKIEIRTFISNMREQERQHSLINTRVAAVSVNQCSLDVATHFWSSMIGGYKGEFHAAQHHHHHYHRRRAQKACL
jgi:hypothetical protein